MKKQTIAMTLAGLSALLGVLIGCHAKPDDAAGQAEELADPERRTNAIQNLQTLYTSALAAAGGDRSVETLPASGGNDERLGPMGVANLSVEALSQTYLDHPEESANGQRILSLLLETQDARALPAFTKALDWRAEVSEQHAVLAAQGIQRMELTEAQKAPVITALSEALDRVQGSRGADNQMRIYFIRALGHLQDRRATPILTKIATRIHEDQSFLINIMAAEEVGRIGDPAAIPSMIRALFLFAPNRPDQRMNDVAGQALTQIGRPSMAPLVELLSGNNEDANRIATTYIAAVRRMNAEAADKMDPRTEVIQEGCVGLGQLGLREGLDPVYAQVAPLLALSPSAVEEGGETHRQTISRAIACSMSLVQINRDDDDTARLRQALIDVYQRVPEGWPPEAPGSSRSQILAAMQHTYDPGLLDFLYSVASDREGLPDFRVLALRSYVFLADREELPRIRAVIAAEPEGGLVRTNSTDLIAPLATAEQCGEATNKLECYIGKLADPDPMVVRKAAYMIARYGRGNAEALTALIEHLDHTNVPVRGDVLYAVDWVATSGSAEAAATIERIREAEEGRSSWVQIKALAMPVRARLQARASNGG